MNKAANDLIELGKYLFDLRYTRGTAGNLSIRLDSGKVLVSPTNSSLGNLSADRLSLLDAQGNHLKGDKPSKEYPFHLAIYENNPDHNAIIHLHSPYLTAYSCLAGLDPNNAIQPFTPYVVMRVGDVAMIPYDKPGDDAIARNCAKVANYNAILMANHGVIVCGKNAQDACGKFEELEDTAKLYFMLKNHEINYLSDSEIEQLKGM